MNLKCLFRLHAYSRFEECKTWYDLFTGHYSDTKQGDGGQLVTAQKRICAECGFIEIKRF